MHAENPGLGQRAGMRVPRALHAPAAMSPIVPRTRKGMYGMQFDHVRSVAGRGVVDWRALRTRIAKVEGLACLLEAQATSFGNFKRIRNCGDCDPRIYTFSLKNRLEPEVPRHESGSKSGGLVLVLQIG